jgi:hypothetical protein
VAEFGLDSRVSGSGPVASRFEDRSELYSSVTSEKALTSGETLHIFKDAGPCGSIRFVWHLIIFHHLP